MSLVGRVMGLGKSLFGGSEIEPVKGGFLLRTPTGGESSVFESLRPGSIGNFFVGVRAGKKYVVNSKNAQESRPYDAIELDRVARILAGRVGTPPNATFFQLDPRTGAELGPSSDAGRLLGG